MNRKLLFYTLIALFGLGCGKDDPPPSPIVEPDVQEQAVVEDPVAALLVFPFENSECEEGFDVTETESTITFEWLAAEHTDKYDLTVTNLNTGQETQVESNNAQVSLRLQRGTPYEWYVISKSNAVQTTAKSEVWRFYNQGVGTVNYVPFPAQLIAPVNKGTFSAGLIDLEWSGLDIDNDIVGYAVYFGQTDPPTGLLSTNSTEERVEGVSVTPGTYFWYVVTKDAAGNESNSQVFSFIVK